jgi:hypothetical protein
VIVPHELASSSLESWVLSRLDEGRGILPAEADCVELALLMGADPAQIPSGGWCLNMVDSDVNQRKRTQKYGETMRS